MLGLKLIHVSKRSPRTPFASTEQWYVITRSCFHFNDGLVEVRTWMSNYITREATDLFIYLRPTSS